MICKAFISYNTLQTVFPEVCSIVDVLEPQTYKNTVGLDPCPFDVIYREGLYWQLIVHGVHLLQYLLYPRD